MEGAVARKTKRVRSAEALRSLLEEGDAVKARYPAKKGQIGKFFEATIQKISSADGRITVSWLDGDETNNVVQLQTICKNGAGDLFCSTCKKCWADGVDAKICRNDLRHVDADHYTFTADSYQSPPTKANKKARRGTGDSKSKPASGSKIDQTPKTEKKEKIKPATILARPEWMMDGELIWAKSKWHPWSFAFLVIFQALTCSPNVSVLGGQLLSSKSMREVVHGNPTEQVIPIHLVMFC